MSALPRNLPQTEGNVLFNTAANAAAAVNYSKEYARASPRPENGGVGERGGFQRQASPSLQSNHHPLPPLPSNMNSTMRRDSLLPPIDEAKVFQTKAQISAVRKLRRGDDVPEEILVAAKGPPSLPPPVPQVPHVPGVLVNASDRARQLDAMAAAARKAGERREAAMQVDRMDGAVPVRKDFDKVGTVEDAVVAAPGSFKQSPEPVQVVPDHSAAAMLKQKMMVEQGRNGKLPDYAQLVSERERRIALRMQARLIELDALPMDLPIDVRRRAVIEAKQLKLVDLQRQVRSRVTSEMHRLLMSRERINDLMSMARKMRCADAAPPSLVPETARQDMQKLEQKHRLEQYRRNETRKRLMLDSLLVHIQGIRTLSWEVQSTRKRLHKDLERYFRDLARDEERRRRKEQYDRIKALRSNDDEEYLKLLKNTKNTKLLQLLKQTDEYLVQIGAQVEEQKRDALRDREVLSKVPKRNKGKVITGKEKGKAVQAAEGIDDEETDAAIDAMRKRRDQYYTIAHSVKEKVYQPKILVGGTLKPYQIDGLTWLISLFNNNLNGILADEMGLGKTIQTIALLAYLVEVKQNFGPFLIIVPLSTLSNWVRELQVWAPSLLKIIYRGDPATRKRIQKTQLATGNYNVLVTTYEFILKDKAVLGRVKWKYIIIDEGHRMKNADSKLALTLGAKYRSRNRVLLTGTPLQNNLTELWALLNFLLPTIFKSAESFETWFNAPFQAQALGNSELNEEETLLVISRLHQVLRPFMLRRLKTDVEAQLPDKVEAVIRVPMSIWQKTLYRQMRNKLGIGTLSGSPKVFNNMIMQFKKICNHPYIFYSEDVLMNLPQEFLIRAAGKFEMLSRSLPKLTRTGHRTLIFSQMTMALNYLEYLMQYIGIKYLRLDGSTKAEDRQILLENFNEEDSEYSCFLLSTRAGALGLNLQTADTVIIFDSDWNPMMDQQAQDRAHRIGQTKEVRVLRLIVSNSVEEKILEQANRKLQIDAQVIQAGRFNNKVSDADRQKILKELIQSQADLNANEEDAAHSDANMINKILARTEEELELFESMDAEYEELEKQGERKGLMTDESELPEWVIMPEVEEKSKEQVEAELLMSHGRGRRRRKQVLYDDGLTEEQWTRMVEDGKDIEEEAFKRKRKKKAPLKGESEGDGQAEGEANGEADGEADGEAQTEAEEPVPKRRRRSSSRRASSTPGPSDSNDEFATGRSSRRRRATRLNAYLDVDEDENSGENDQEFTVTAKRRSRTSSRSPPS